MTWHTCYLLGAIVTLCLFILACGRIAREMNTTTHIVVTVVGLILTLPVVGVITASILFLGTN
jgi:hypothetical protein